MPTKAELVKTSLRATVTESAANTFTEATMSTNLAVRGDHLFIVTGIWWDLSANLSGPGDTIQFQITYATQSAIIRPDDPDWLFGFGWRHDHTTSGGGLWERGGYQAINDFPVAVPTLYMGLQGTSLAGAAVGGVKIEGYHQKVATSEYFRIAQSR